MESVVLLLLLLLLLLQFILKSGTITTIEDSHNIAGASRINREIWQVKVLLQDLAIQRWASNSNGGHGLSKNLPASSVQQLGMAFLRTCQCDVAPPQTETSPFPPPNLLITRRVVLSVLYV